MAPFDCNVGQTPIYRSLVDTERPSDLSLGHPCRKTNSRFPAFGAYLADVPWANFDKSTPKNPLVRMPDGFPVELALFESPITNSF